MRTKFYRIDRSGLTLFEITLTLVISSIIAMIGGLFISSSVDIVTKLTAESLPNDTNQFIKIKIFLFNILNNDFINNKGNYSLGQNNDELYFTVIHPINPSKTTTISYSCNRSTKMLFRKIEGFNEEPLLEQIQSCFFELNRPNNKDIQLNYNITYLEEGRSVTISNFIIGPYVL